MPGFLLHAGAAILCSHAGQAQPTMPNPRVRVMGQPTVALGPPWTVAGCTLPPPPDGNGPCTAAHYVTAAARVRSNRQPLLLADSQAICEPTGTGLVVAVTQNRVRGV